MELDKQQQLAYHNNLIDAGCDKAEALRCMDLIQDNKIAELIKTLEKIRIQKLDSIHINQKQLDCLDYFVYKIKQKSTSMEK